MRYQQWEKFRGYARNVPRTADLGRNVPRWTNVRQLPMGGPAPAIGLSAIYKSPGKTGFRLQNLFMCSVDGGGLCYVRIGPDLPCCWSLLYNCHRAESVVISEPSIRTPTRPHFRGSPPNLAHHCSLGKKKAHFFPCPSHRQCHGPALGQVRIHYGAWPGHVRAWSNRDVDQSRGITRLGPAMELVGAVH